MKFVIPTVEKITRIYNTKTVSYNPPINMFYCQGFSKLDDVLQDYFDGKYIPDTGRAAITFHIAEKGEVRWYFNDVESRDKAYNKLIADITK